jgi:hypothetical protein
VLKSGRNSLLLSELDELKGEKLDSVKEFELLSAGMLTIEEHDRVDQEMRRKIDSQVRLYVQNRYYTLRLLSSAALFLAVYLFCSLVIRDPIPMIDELALALLSSIALWIVMAKSEGNGAAAIKLKLDLDEMYHESKETFSPFIDKVDAWLYDLHSAFDRLALADALGKVDNVELPALDGDGGEEKVLLCSMLSYHINKNRTLRKLWRDIKVCGKEDKNLAARIVAAEMNGEDIYLLALLLELEK